MTTMGGVPNLGGSADLVAHAFKTFGPGVFKAKDLFARYKSQSVSSLGMDDLILLGNTIGFKVDPESALAREVVDAVRSDSADNVMEALAKPEVYQKLFNLKSDVGGQQKRKATCRVCNRTVKAQAEDLFYECECGRIFPVK